MSQAGARWQIDGETGHLQCGPLVARVLFAASGVQIVVESWQGRPASGQLPLLHTAFGERLERGLRIVERYVRGNDLIASYESTGADRVAPEIYWRASNDLPRSAAKIELIVSSRTDLLDSRPQFSVATHSGPAQWFMANQLDGSAWRDCSNCHVEIATPDAAPEQLCLFRDASLGMSYAQMVHPSDFAALRLESTTSAGLLEVPMFRESLEKGVIRRGRVCAWFLPCENDLETALALAREFVKEPLPLTA